MNNMSPEKGRYTLAEILSQPEAWAGALAILNSNKSLILDIDPARRYDHIIYTTTWHWQLPLLPRN
jgi:hypothetical protein